MLGLLSPELFFIACHLSLHFRFFHLVGPLLHDAVNLVLTKSLKVIWFEAVVSKHAFSGGEVFGHQIVRVGIFLLVLAPPCKVLLFLGLPITFFLGKLQVCISGCVTHHLPLSIVFLLGLFQQVIQVSCLLIDHLVTELLLLFVELLFSNLLLSPVSHLHRLHAHTVAITYKRRFSKNFAKAQQAQTSKSAQVSGYAFCEISQ